MKGNTEQDDVLGTDVYRGGNTIENEPLATPSCDKYEHEKKESHVSVQGDSQSVYQGTECETINRGTECEKNYEDGM